MKKTIFIIYFQIILFLVIFSSLAHANTFEDVLKNGKLRVGVAMYEPWVIKNKDGNLDGFEIQIANQIAKDMGVSAEFVTVKWEELINSLESNKFDVIISGMAITPARALRVNFSNPYASSGIGIVACIAQTKSFNSLAELNEPGIKIAAVSKTVSEKLAGKVFSNADIRSYSTIEEAKDAVIEGEVHALVESSAVAKFLALSHPGQVDVPLSESLLTYKTGVAVKKGEYDFLNYLNSWITAREAEGWIESRQQYWFESLEWKKVLEKE